MKPTVGRIVHYIPEWAGATGDTSKPLPAIIVHVHDDDAVSLGVFGRSYYSATATHREPVLGQQYSELRPGTWFWPPKEKP